MIITNTIRMNMTITFSFTET